MSPGESLSELFKERQTQMYIDFVGSDAPEYTFDVHHYWASMLRSYKLRMGLQLKAVLYRRTLYGPR